MSGSVRSGDDRMFEFRQEQVDDEQPADGTAFTVLSVDDDPAFQQSLRMALSDFRFNDSPLRLLTASSSGEARWMGNPPRLQRALIRPSGTFYP